MTKSPEYIADESLIVNNKNNLYQKFGNNDDDDNSEQEEVDYCWTVHQDLLRRQRDEWHRSRPFTMDDGTKHTPFITELVAPAFKVVPRKATVVVGNGQDVGGVYHPMMASNNPAVVHFITHIYALDQRGRVFAMATMDPTLPGPATVSFQVPEDVIEMTAYEFCNLHGLYQGPKISTNGTSINNSNDTESLMKVNDDDQASIFASPWIGDQKCQVGSPKASAWDSLAADFVRRQSLPPFDSLEPYNQLDGYGQVGTEHTPFIELERDDEGYTTVVVKVGQEGQYHEMRGVAPRGFLLDDINDLDSHDDSSDRRTKNNEPHWITHVYVVGPIGNIVAMVSLDPTNATLAEMKFTIAPQDTDFDDTSTLTAYAFCNVHGLYQGPTYDKATGKIISKNTNDGEEFSAGDEGGELLMESSSSIESLPWQFGAMVILMTVATVAFYLP